VSRTRGRAKTPASLKKRTIKCHVKGRNDGQTLGDYSKHPKTAQSVLGDIHGSVRLSGSII
jgi:hypothetical protein